MAALGAWGSAHLRGIQSHWQRLIESRDFLQIPCRAGGIRPRIESQSGAIQGLERVTFTGFMKKISFMHYTLEQYTIV
jgi:hypothetical protein